MQFAGGFLCADGRALHQQHGARIEALLHLHDGNAGLAIPCHDGALDGGRAAPARQQGRMNVEAAKAGCVEDGLRQDQPISGNDCRIQIKRPEGLLRGVIPQLFRRAYLDALRGGKSVHRRRRFGHAAARLARRLRIDGHHVMTSGNELGQGWNRKIRRAHEGKAQGHRHDPPKTGPAYAGWASFFAFCSFLSIICRFRRDRWSMNSTPSRWSISCWMQVARSPSQSISRSSF